MSLSCVCLPKRARVYDLELDPTRKLPVNPKDKTGCRSDRTVYIFGSLQVNWCTGLFLVVDQPAALANPHQLWAYSGSRLSDTRV
ncbi:hypothetical protein GO755_20605 [Spirosoma sp. HMF4905]|uniref:Uncharacterized protein n=1 Tax=Spirosoma arboris TaxID=2682092 RepID=A0A7K1SFH5_9BACT|nr:hypothetical protein [Spirosoma arboris]MVM32458.1 hypothetical protein [Spirosoma arboris]